jgi:hypothetical protein
MNPTSPTPETKYPLKNILIVSGFALVIIIALSVGLLLKYSKPQEAATSTDQSHVTTVKSEAQSEYALAQSARNKGDVTQAKTALIKAKALYAQAKDTSRNKDIDSQLAALDTASDAKPPQAPAAALTQ